MRIAIVLMVLCVVAVVWGQSASDKPPADKRTSQSSDTGDARAEAAKLDAGEQQDKVVRTEKEWRKLLTREQFRVLRTKGTERPFSNKYDRHFEPGTYECAACGQELFQSEAKFNSGCGWPAFYAAKAGDRVVMTPDLSQGMVRTEVTCARCGSHLGHLFDDAPQTPTGQRFCINSVSLKFIPAESPSPKTGRDEKSPDAKSHDEKPQERKQQDQQEKRK